MNYLLFKEQSTKILKLSWPIIIGQLGIVLMGAMDAIMVGKIGHTALAAVGFSNYLFYLISIFGIGLLIATASIFSMEFTKNGNKNTALFIRDSILSGQMVSAILFVIMLLCWFKLDAFGQKPEIIKESKWFFLLIGISIFPMNLYISIKNVCDGFQKTKISMYITYCGLFCNFIINVLLIYGNFGFPKMGIIGAGIGTLAARVIMVILIYIFVVNDKDMNVKGLQIFDFKTKPMFMNKIFKIGIPTAFQYLFEVAAFSIAGIMAGWLGSEIAAAHQIALNLASTTYMIGTGIAAGGSVLVAQHFQNKDKKGILETGKATLILLIIFMGFFSFIFIVFNSKLPIIYNSEHHVVNMASKLLLFAAAFQIFDGLQCGGLAILRGIEDTKWPSIMVFIIYWCLCIPISFISVTYFDLGINTIWMCLTLSLAIISILCIYRFLQKRFSF